MSVRAYKIEIPAQLKDTPSFNLWRDEDIFNFIDRHDDTNTRLEDGAGSIETSVKAIKDLLKAVKMPKEYRDGFKDDIKGLRDDDAVGYECF